MVQALEAIMVALIILGAAYSVVTLRAAGGSHDKSRVNLGKLASDSLTVLGGLEDANGTLLDQAITGQFHCARDPVPSPTSCSAGRGDLLTEKLDHYLPAGTGYAVSLGNGVRAQELYRTGHPMGESVAADLSFTPGWNMTFVVTELSCYDASQAVNATLLTLAHARSVNATRAYAQAEGVNATTSLAGAGRWNATWPAATRPAAATLVANATAKAAGSLPGLTAWGSCALGAAGDATVAALRQDALVLPASAPLGAPATLGANLDHLAALPGATLVGANLTLYEPIPGRPGEPDTWIPAAVLDLGAGSAPRATWTPPDEALFGAHPVVLRAAMRAGSVSYEARLVGLLPVALPNGIVPSDPPYRAQLQAWLPEWR